MKKRKAADAKREEAGDKRPPQQERFDCCDNNKLDILC